jgi:hypothetical protein
MHPDPTESTGTGKQCHICEGAAVFEKEGRWYCAPHYPGDPAADKQGRALWAILTFVRANKRVPSIEIAAERQWWLDGIPYAVGTPDFDLTLSILRRGFTAIAEVAKRRSRRC